MKLIRSSANAILIAALVGLAGCGFMTEKRKFGPTLADLPDVEVPAAAQPVPEASLDQIEQSYRAALEIAESPELRHRINVRLADIEMARSENRQLTQAEHAEHFRDAIAMYDQLLALNETKADSATDERLLYRLSKAYALDGRMAESEAALVRLVQLYPNSPYAAEADFRRAEQAFNRGEYEQAQALYQHVVDVGAGTPFHVNAIYMLGWSQFKANQFSASVKSFTLVLDKLVQGSGKEPGNAGQNDSKSGLLNDTFHVLAITFTYLDGPRSITEMYQEMGERPYQHLVYRHLGEFYLEKTRYQDAADTYSHYIETFPNSEHGPEFAIQMIEVYRVGGFAEKILPAKENFVRQYGVRSSFWASQNPEQQTKLREHLHSFLGELSSYYHAEGQTLAAAEKTYQQQGRKGTAPESAVPMFMHAAKYYDEFIQSFPDSPKVAEMTFLQGEALFEAGALDQAVAAYEKVAYDIIDSERGARAGYAAILTLQTLIDQADNAEKKAELSAHKVRSAISFADYYPSDERAVPVLTAAAETEFAKGNSAQAVTIAERIVKWQPAAAEDLRRTSWLIIAHSQFDKQDFVAAEQSYRQALALMSPADKNIESVRERIAASMYKQGEALVAAGNSAGGVAMLMNIGASAPGSELAIRAQYDAGNYLMEAKDWSGAEKVFTDFERRFGDHNLAPSIAPKKAMIYQELKQWDKAAAVLAVMASDTSNPDAARQALYLSAELYQKAERYQDASMTYREYVKRYPQPFDLAIEARYQLVQLAEKRNDSIERNLWLEQLIFADAKAGKSSTDRSRYLAAYASNQFAGQTYAKFESIKLTQPIKNSFKAKKAALDETMTAYKKVLDYGVAEFVTEANYRIGIVYSQLSRDLLDSERPQGLDELAMEQYELLLEEQAEPFEEKSVELLEANAARSWEGFYDPWVKNSLTALAKILPARYGKKETVEEISNELY